MKPHIAPLQHKYLKDRAYQYDATELCSVVLDDERFPIWSGSSKPEQHHYGKHGLVLHTAEVAMLCLNNNEFYGRLNGGQPIDERKLFLAALFHDAGKMWDYEPFSIYDETTLTGEIVPAYTHWRGSTHKRRIHHISRSALVWQETCIKNPADWLSQEYIDDVLHAILAHHGLREWGSPVAPNTQLAWMLHFCDGISARMEDCSKFDRVTKRV